MIDRNTGLKGLIEEYPWLKEELPRMNNKFKMINSPMGKMLMKKATIGEMSKRSGMEEGLLIEKIQNLIKEHV